MRAAKVQASLRIRAVSPEPPLLAHTSSESRGTFRQKARSLVPLNGWACAVTICHDGMLEDTNSLDGAHLIFSTLMQRCSSRKPKRDVLDFEPLRGLVNRPQHFRAIVTESFVCLFVLEFYGPVNNEVMSSRSVKSGIVPGQALT